MRAARVANFPRSYKFIVPCSVRGVGVDGRRGRWFVYIASTPPQAGGIMSIFLPLSARARLSLYVCPYIYFYIYIGPYR